MVEALKMIPQFGTVVVKGYVADGELSVYLNAGKKSPGVVLTAELPDGTRKDTISSADGKTYVETPLIPVEICATNRMVYSLFRRRVEYLTVQRSAHPRHNKA